MRWALVKVCVAVTTMVVVAFAVPLGLVIREMARDRAFSNAEREAAAIAPALSITTDRRQLQMVVASAGSDEEWPSTYPRATVWRRSTSAGSAPSARTSPRPGSWAGPRRPRSPVVPRCSSPSR